MTAPKDKIDKQIFNLGYQNLSITKISEIVQKVIKNKFDKKDIEIKKLPSNDPRSYHINSGKIEEVLGFKPRKTIENAIEDLCDAFKNNLYEDTFNNDIYHNISRLKKLGLNKMSQIKKLKATLNLSIQNLIDKKVYKDLVKIKNLIIEAKK